MISDIVDFALSMVGKPARAYTGVFSGNNPSGFDCSGLVQYVLLECGYELPIIFGGKDIKYPLRKTYQLFSYLPKAENPNPGDIGFISRNGRRITHAFILVDEGMIVDSPGKDGGIVRLRDLDSMCFTPRYEIGQDVPQKYYHNPVGFVRPTKKDRTLG